MYLCDLISSKFLYISQEISNSFPRLTGSQEKKAALPLGHPYTHISHKQHNIIIRHPHVCPHLLPIHTNKIHKQEYF